MDLINYLKDELDCKDKELFLVVTSEVEKDQSWLKDPIKYATNVGGSGQERDAEVVQLKDIPACDVTINPLCNNSDFDLNQHIS